MESCLTLCVISAILFSVASGDERDRYITGKSFLVGDGEVTDYISIEGESSQFLTSGICALERNSSGLTLCDGEEHSIQDLYALKRSQCFCDPKCHDFHDCCIDRVATGEINSKQLSCRNIRSEFRFPIYVYQTCPSDWEEGFIRTLCEVEASELATRDEYYNHLQEIPVHSIDTKVLYRNIYCAVCNEDMHLTKWRTHFHCNGDSRSIPIDVYTPAIDFSESSYNPRKNSWKVKIDERMRICRLIVEEFKPHVLLPEFGARFCKSVIESCPASTDRRLTLKCKAYSSYVYEQDLVNGARIAYKNFHCAQCNNISVEQLTCVDPFNPLIRADPLGKASLSLLFDFNFGGEDNQVGHSGPCSLVEGQIWDPLLRQCLNVTCGKRYRREGLRCILAHNDTDIGLESDCNKAILRRNLFILLDNGSIYVNYSSRVYNVSEYELYKKENGEIVEILICVEESFFLSLSKIQTLISEITLSVSVICLILHLFVYGLLSNLRNCPGKVLMSLSGSLLCGHLFLLIGPYFRGTLWLCYTSAVATHFGYLSAFFWMSVMAFDIHRTFSTTQARSSNRSQSFKKYAAYAWSSTSAILLLSILVDQTASASTFSPRYGDPICWFNQRKGLFLFFIVPVAVLLLANTIFFSKTAFEIRRVSRQTKMVNSLSERVRYYLYIKLSVVLGLAWIFGFLAASLKSTFLWYPFIVLNGLQGALIFAVFTLKRKILHMLSVRLKLRSRTYRMGKESQLKKAMYSSLSNLSTLQTTLTTHVAPVMGSSSEMLKAVRKINPETELKNT